MNSNDYGSTRLVVLNSFYLQSWYNNVLHGFAICLECVRTKTWDKLNATEWIAVAFSVLLYLDQFVLLFLWGIQGWYHQIITEAHYCMIKPRETQSHCQYVTKCKDDMTCTPQHEGESESSHSRRWLQRTKSCLCYCVFLLLIFHIFSILMSCHNWFVVSSTLFFFFLFYLCYSFLLNIKLLNKIFIPLSQEQSLDLDIQKRSFCIHMNKCLYSITLRKQDDLKTAFCFLMRILLLFHENKIPLSRYSKKMGSSFQLSIKKMTLVSHFKDLFLLSWENKIFIHYHDKTRYLSCYLQKTFFVVILNNKISCRYEKLT